MLMHDVAFTLLKLLPLRCSGVLGLPGVSVAVLEFHVRQKNAERTWRARILFQAEEKAYAQVRFSGLLFPL